MIQSPDVEVPSAVEAAAARWRGLWLVQLGDIREHSEVTVWKLETAL